MADLCKCLIAKFLDFIEYFDIFEDIFDDKYLVYLFEKINF